jgi:type IV secretory pathway protease TraF
MLAFAGAVNAPRLVWNFTPSIPVGLYVIEQRQWQQGDRVALKPTGRLKEALSAAAVLKDGRLLMKRVAAIAGDEVCRTKLIVSINHVPRVAARDEPNLPSWSGCVLLQTGEVFLLGDTESSFDGRYFGITSASDIVAPLSPILTYEQRPLRVQTTATQSLGD